MLKILLLEDSPIDAEIVHRMLEKELAETNIQLAINKKTFLSLLDTFIPDVIVSDNSLPQFNATEALKIVRGRNLNLPFILVTGTVSEEYAADIMKLGADDYILKDRMARLPAAIETAVDRRRVANEKMEAAERLRQNEEKYRTMMERVSDAFVALDKDWNYTYVNKQAGIILNREPKDLIGKNIWIEFPEGIDQPFYKAYHQAIQTQQYIHLEEHYLPFAVWLENHIYPSPNGISIFFRDITARKEAERMLIQSEENLKAIFDNTSEGFILLDQEGNVKALNDRAAQTILFTTDNPVEIGNSILDFVEPARTEHFKNVISRVLDGQSIEYDRPYILKDGQANWINFSFNPVQKATGITGICITGRDITESKRAEQRREFDHNNLNALISNTQDLLWSVDRSMRLITYNQAFNDAVKLLSGVALVKGADVLSASSNEEEKERFLGYYQRALGGETFTETEYAESPIEYCSEISFNPIYEKGTVIGTACFSRNVTDRRKAEKLLYRLEQEKLQARLEEQKKISRAVVRTQEIERNAIGMELHDNVNQLLVGTNLMLSMVKGDPEKHANLLEPCMNQLREAIEENRKIAHAFASPNLETETLASQIRNLLQNMLGTAGIDNAISAEFFVETDLDSDRKFNIYRIAQEQCTNIVKYAEATSVNITLRTDDSTFTMTISDNGKGAADFNKGGVGLRNIKGRLALFDGTIKIVTAPGQGFTLEIIIPL